ncbi:MAG: hypothetical protein OEX09_08445 [Candidatus Bathyarchaeota archaeon]|nr:hypothetical protein [Candidatus Bathyarchaeota archaeon]MDH5733328.1 hypothetical protein [Candidatus Bathyarchaeota archaeon]
MILVFAVVFLFLWGYRKQFPHGNRLKMILAVAGVGLLVSLLASYPSVYDFYWGRNPLDVWFSLPFYLDAEAGPVEFILNTGNVWYRIYLAGVQLQEMKFSVKYVGDGGYIFPSWQTDVDITASVLSQLFLIFTALNMTGIPLAALTYKLKIGKPWKKFISTIS